MSNFTRTRERKLSKRSAAVTRAGFSRAACATQPEQTSLRQTVVFGTPPAMHVEEDGASYKFTVALLPGTESRFVYIMAAPRSIIIEVRRTSCEKQKVRDSHITENLDFRFSREFHLPHDITRGMTTAHLQYGVLEMTAQKYTGEQSASWSEFIKV